MDKISKHVFPFTLYNSCIYKIKRKEKVVSTFSNSIIKILCSPLISTPNYLFVPYQTRFFTNCYFKEILAIKIFVHQSGCTYCSASPSAFYCVGEEHLCKYFIFFQEERNGLSISKSLTQ